MTLFEPPTGSSGSSGSSGWYGADAPYARPAPVDPVRRRRDRRAIGVVIVAIALALGGGLWTMQQSAGLPWEHHEPSAEVVALADRAQLTDTGRQLLYSLRPELVDATKVADVCGGSERVAAASAAGDGTSPLGCYLRNLAGRQIVLYDPLDERLAGMLVTTTAHELLHAVYDAMPASEQSEIDGLMEVELARVPADDPVRLQIDASVGSHDSSIGTERFAYLGSQIEPDGGFAPRLEEIYARYFLDRHALVEVFRRTDAVVPTITRELDAAWAALAAEEQANLDARAKYQSDRASHGAEVAAYNEEVARFNAASADQRARGRMTRTAPDGTTTVLPWGESLAQWQQELDAVTAELEARSPSLDAAEAATAAKRDDLEVREQDAVALVEAAYPGTDLK